ncbi:MarR family protein [compost metagenome]
MNAKEALFQQTVAFVASVHQVHTEWTKLIPMDGITPLQYRIIEYLMVHQPLSPSQISACMDVSMPNTSRELKKLTDKGLCEKFNDPSDRRKQYFRLSPAGEQYMGHAFTCMQEQLGTQLEGLSEAELGRIMEAMQLLQETVFKTASLQSATPTDGASSEQF